MQPRQSLSGVPPDPVNGAKSPTSTASPNRVKVEISRRRVQAVDQFGGLTNRFRRFAAGSIVSWAAPNANQRPAGGTVWLQPDVMTPGPRLPTCPQDPPPQQQLLYNRRRARIRSPRTSSLA